MLSRRQFLMSATAAAPARLTGRQRVDRALAGADLDRPPFSFWRHFGLEKEPGERHARATLEFQRKFRTDLVKVMSDYPFPRPKGPWWETPVHANPFPQQVRALQLIRQGLGGRNYFVETIFNSWNQAEKLSSPAEVRRLMYEKPQALLDALEAINRSQINHARLALRAGAAGIFLAIANADAGVLSREEYRNFSEPFDKALLEAVRQAPLNILHLHGEQVYLDLFYKGWLARVIHYSTHATGIGFDQVRRSYSGVLMGGLDERHFRRLSEDQLREQWREAAQTAGRKFILAPGCSVPNDTMDEELMRLVRALAPEARAT
ncbi:MAG: uroporphyrinogen decarboxylase family protein, partial [Bryobacteraceae bacterium]